MIYVTHDQVEAMTMGTRVCIMDQGRVVQIGEPIEVYRNPANTFVASFLGSPPTNIVPGHISRSEEVVRLSTLGAELNVPDFIAAGVSSLTGDDVLFGVRPEDIYFNADDAGESRSGPVQVEVVAVEPLGAETMVVLSTQSNDEIIARVGRDTKAKIGGRGDVFIDLEAVHLFDPVSTNVLPRTAPAGK